MKASQNHLPSLLIAIVFILGALLLLGISLFMGLAVLVSFTKTGIKAEQTILLVAFSFEGIILLAAAFFSLQKYLQKPSADQGMSIPFPNGLIALFALIAGASILLGSQVGGNKQVNWLILPILTIPAIVLPLIVLLGFGTKGVPFGTRSQTWSILGLAMTLGPLVLFTLEIVVAIIILFIAVVYVMARPELASELQALARQIMILGPRSKATLDLLSPLLMKPGVIVTSLIYIAVLVPALEEIFKPLGVWLFAGKLESQAQGFALGALSGAGYALIETVGVSAQTTDWASLLFTRIGTGLLHVTTSALMGAAIVLAWHERRFVRLVGTYLLAVLFHGSWNAIATLFSFSSIAESLDRESLLSRVQPVLVVAMVILAIGLLVTLVVSNRKMRGNISSPPTQAKLPNDSVDTGKTV